MQLGEIAPFQPLQLTVVTERLIIQGTARTRRKRVTDVFNEADTLTLVLTDVTFMELGSRRIVGQAAIGQVALESILFGHTTSATEGAPEMRTTKLPVRATLLVPPFTIEGLIHLSLEPELRQALEEFQGRFMPVTAARYWAFGVAEAPREVDLLVVNHVKAHVGIPAGVDWDPQSAMGDLSKDHELGW